jgi:hypothetical protein
MSSCCASFKWSLERDLGEARGFDFGLGSCASCGRPWVSVFVPASQGAGYEPVDLKDLERMRSLPEGRELKAFMKSWAVVNLD